MSCCHCQGIESLFDEKMATNELEKYRKKGAKKTTQILIDALIEAGLQNARLLDIGGGVGELQHELVKFGISGAVSVEGSSAYIAASKEEAHRLGHGDRVVFQNGDFIKLAPEIEPAEVVTLDRVICCYPDADSLVRLSVERAQRLYGIVYPRELWWIKLFFQLQNLFIKLSKNPFRMFVHPTKAVESVIGQAGLQRRFYRHTFLWQIVVYERS